MTQAAKMTQLAIAALEDKKAEDITLIDIAKVSVLADYFLIARKQPKPGAGNGGQCRRTTHQSRLFLKKHGRLSDRKLDLDGLRRSRRTCV